MQHSSKHEAAVPAAAFSSVIANFQDFLVLHKGNARWFYYVNMRWFFVCFFGGGGDGEGGESDNLEKKKEQKIWLMSSTVSLWGTTICKDGILWIVCWLGFFAFFLAGMHITSVWMRWCRCSVKWFWSSHYSSWMQTWTPRTISQHYFLWVLLHLTLLGACLLVCRSLPEVLPGW